MATPQADSICGWDGCNAKAEYHDRFGNWCDRHVSKHSYAMDGGYEERYWEDDLYQLNQNEADDYRDEF